MYKPISSFILVLIMINSGIAQNKIKYPLSSKEDSSDIYFGISVKDPYRWLEDDRSAKTEAWVKSQNLVTEKYLSEIPNRNKINTRLTELWNYNKESAPYKKGKNFFCYKNNGLQNQSVLYIKKNMDDKGEVLLDPNTLSVDGTISLGGTSVSKNGKILAYGLSRSGSDWVEIHFRDIETKQDLPDVLKWVKFSGMSWKGDGIFYSRYNEPTESAYSQKNEYHKVYYHQIGTSQDKDQLIFEDKTQPEYNFSANVTEDENYLCLYISQSTSGHQLLIKDLKNKKSEFIKIASTFDYENSIIDNIGNTFYLHTNDHAPNYKLVSFTLDKPEEINRKTIIPESEHLMEGVRLCNQKILVNYLQDVSSKLFCYSISGKFEKEVLLPGLCKLNGFSSDKTYDFATYSISQFTSPDQNYYLDAKTWESKLIFKPNIKFDSENYITKQIFYNSKDGTKIPMFITHKKGITINEETPCFVFGYGGFNISYTPEFRIDRAVFIEAGGIYCVPNIRGGGEYGENWHKAGTKCNKQNVFDDFMAACDYLVANKYTSYQKIAIHGRSNGGLLIGAVITQRPDICKVAIPTVGVLDMLRFHLFTIGRAWTVDYGCIENKEEFDCLYQYSPLHHLKNEKYPATLILTGDHDDRVVPAHSFKFAATLQEKNIGELPCIIRIDVNAGHGAGKPTLKQINEFTDMWAFVFYNLNIKY